MANGFKNNAESPFDYVLERAIITSSRFNEGASVDIKNVITDIEIYEHLDKPYLTGNVLFVDDNNIYNSIDFSGFEKLSLEFSLPDTDSLIPIKKDFIIEKTSKNARSNDRASAVLVHIVEEHAFNSSLINVNKAYTGKPVDIIQKIIVDNLNKEFSSPVLPDAQEEIKVLVPNLTPLAAAQWVRDRATTVDGVPYYFFSTLANSKLHIIGLDQMLSVAPDPKPYVYSQIAASIVASLNISEQAHLIQDFKSKSNDEIISLIQKGFMGSQNYFYDPIIGSYIDGAFFNLNAVLTQLIYKDIIRKDQNRLRWSEQYELDGAPITFIKSKVNTNLVTTNTYDDNVNNYSQAATLTEHKLKVISEALREIIVRNSIDVALPGRNFLNGTYSNTIGNQIKMEFLSTDTSGNPDRLRNIDTKKSGSYLIYAIKHHFKKERYDVIASCVKLADLPPENN
jgi:hypothetical protein